MLSETLQVFLKSSMARFEIADESLAVADFDEHTAKVTVKGQTLGLPFDGGDGAFQFRHLVSHRGHLLPCSLHFPDDDLEAFEFAHGLAEGRPLKNAVVPTRPHLPR